MRALGLGGVVGCARAHGPDPGLLLRADRPFEREIDENSDGKIDRVENFQNGRVAAVGIDSDGDGKIERWQTWVGGRMVSEEIDIDGDGISDRRLRYGANGHFAGMDILTTRAVKATAAAPAR